MIPAATTRQADGPELGDDQVNAMRRRTPNDTAAPEPRCDPTAPMDPAEKLVAWLSRLDPDTQSRSRRHGHRPAGRRDMEHALLRDHFGLASATIGELAGLSIHAVRVSIRRGRVLLARGMKRGAFDGFSDPDPEPAS